MKELHRKGNKIAIVTARPKKAEKSTLRRFAQHDVPCDSLHCVGFGKGTRERKLEVILEKGIDIYYDKDPRTVDFLNSRNVNASTILN